MTQSLPPPSAKLSKDKTTIAIILAVLVHILLASIVYFTVFNKENTSSPDDSQISNNQLPSKDIAEDQLIVAEDLPLSDTTATVAMPSDQVDDNTDNVKAANVGRNSAVKVKNDTFAIRDESNIEPPMNDNRIVSNSESTPSNSSEYELKKTQEYQQLDDDIDKNNEQLSKLIGEIKKYNQNNIQQHQGNEAPKQPAPSLTPAPSVQYDYPITPIDPPNNQ